jgi:hypothetical protein
MAKDKTTDPFKRYRINGKFSLSDFDPESRPFAKGDEADQRAKLESLASELDELQDLLHANVWAHVAVRRARGEFQSADGGRKGA